MKSLDRVQTIAKVLKILSMIVFVCSIVILSILSILLIVFCFVGNNVEFVNFFARMGLPYEFNTVLCALICLILQFIGSIIIYSKVVRFYKLELELGNPFDKPLIKEMRKVGVWRIVLPIVLSVIIATITACFGLSLNMSALSGVTMGIVYLIVSCILEYGSEMKKNRPTNTTRK